MQRSNIISFPVEIAKIEAELAERGQRIHPIELDKVKGASYPQRRSKSFWNKRTATVYGFPLGRPLSRSGGRIVEYVKASGQLLSHKLKILRHATFREFGLNCFINVMTCFCRYENRAHRIPGESRGRVLRWPSVCDVWGRQSGCCGNPL